MICDICNSSLPFDDYMEAKTVEAISEDNTLIKVFGSMPKDAYVSVNSISKEEAFGIAQKYNNLAKEDIIYAYDISLNSPTMEYQPAKYNKFVKIELSNIEIEDTKEYAMLHAMDDAKYEIIPIQKLSNNKISFNATSFSPYILITVEGYNVTFEGENYRVYDIQGNEITDGATIASGTDFAFTIIPNDEYGVTDVTCVNSASESVVEVSGYIKGKTGRIASVTEDLTINVTTAIAPKVTTHPETAKIKAGTTAKFTVVAENATTYQWQYRENRDTYWKDVTSSMGSGYSSATYTISAADYVYSGYEFRCLVGDTNFTQHERISTDIVTLSIAEDDVVVGETPVILVQPTMEKAKVEVDTGKASYSVTALGNDLTFTWQYRENRDTYWKAITSSIASSTTTTIDSSTSNPTKKSTLTTTTASYSLSGYEFRCLVGNTYYANHDAVKSDIVAVSVADNDVTTQIKYHDLGIAKQPKSQKIELGQTATYTIEKTGTSTVNSYKWQYKPSGDAEQWLDVDATLGTSNTVASGYNTATLSVNTSNMAVDENLLTISNNLSGYLFRCVVSNSSLARIVKNSDAAFLSVVQGDISEENIKVKTQPTLEAPSPVTLAVEGNAEITLEYVGDGTLSVVSSDETIATASIIGNIMRIRGIRTGTARLTLMASAGELYASSSTTIEVTVNEKQLMTDVIATNYEDVYDGVAHGITLSGSELTGATVTYGTTLGNYDLTEAPTYIDVGNYTVYFKVSKAGYEDYEGSATVIINKRPVKVVWENLNLTYNGTQQTPTATIDSGVPGETIKISITGYGINVGTYNAKAKMESVEGGQGKVSNYVLEK